MKKAVIVFVLGLVMAAAAFAQGTPQTKSGSKSLMFSINGFGDFGVSPTIVGDVPGGDSNGSSNLFGPSMRFFLSDDVALRVGLGFGTSTVSPAVDSIGVKSSETMFAIAPAVEIHLMQAGPVSFYTGGGVSFGMSSGSSTPRNIDSLQSSTSATGISFGALLGAEFFPWDNLSLSAEYQLGVTLLSSSSEFRGTTTDGPSTTSIGIGGPVRVTLALIFD